MKFEEFAELSAGHALHALGPEQERAFEAALAAHPEWQHLVDEDLETAAEVGSAVPECAPSAHVRSNLLSLISSTPQRAPLDAPPSEHDNDKHTKHPALPLPEGNSEESTPAARPSARTRRRSLWAGAFVLAASLVVFATVAVGQQLFVGSESEDPSVAALTQVSQANDAQAETVDVSGGGKVTLHWSRDLDRAVLVGENMPQLRSDQDFEVWVVRSGTAISAGVMGSRDQPTVVAEFQPGDVVAVTIEQTGGSPTGVATTDPIFAIPTA